MLQARQGQATTTRVIEKSKKSNQTTHYRPIGYADLFYLIVPLRACLYGRACPQCAIFRI